jgi:hypothetical protein
LASATDNFNRANESPIAAPWSAHSNGSIFELASNGIDKPSGQQGDAYIAYVGSCATADQYSEIKQVAGVTGNDWGPAVRVGGAGNAGVAEGYFVDANPGPWTVGKHVNGFFSTIGTLTQAQPVNGDVLRIEVVGTTLTMFKNGVNIGSTTDGSITGAGDGAGVFIYDTGGSLDDWAGGDIGGTPTPMRPTLELVSQAVQRGSRG